MLQHLQQLGDAPPDPLSGIYYHIETTIWISGSITACVKINNAWQLEHIVQNQLQEILNRIMQRIVGI